LVKAKEGDPRPNTTRRSPVAWWVPRVLTGANKSAGMNEPYTYDQNGNRIQSHLSSGGRGPACGQPILDVLPETALVVVPDVKPNLLGSGGMGQVLLARHGVLERTLEAGPSGPRPLAGARVLPRVQGDKSMA
jgi:hypothetical protein